MSKLTQKAAVYEATMNILAENDIPADDNQVPAISSLVTKEMRANVIAVVTQGIITGEVDFSQEASAKYDTAEKIKGYVTGMVSNHYRKDSRLNGGVKHEIKNPGSRAGSQDETIKALKALRTTRTDATELAEIDACIAARQAEIKPSKTVELTAEQIEKLPAELREKLGL
jgi:hypothetical protein